MLKSKNANIILFKEDNSFRRTPEPPRRMRKQFVYGNIVTTDFDKTTYAERVRVGLNIKARTDPKTASDWDHIVKRKEPIQVGRPRQFRIDEAFWFSAGSTWIIPTKLFGQNTIKVNLQPSALLAGGFTVELHLRYTTIVKEFEADPKLSSGGELKIDVQWALYPAIQEATPQLEVAEWKPTESPQPESPHNTSFRSGSPYFELQSSSQV